MNILKNFEALFVATLGLACAANYVLDDHVATEQTVARLSAPAASTSLSAMPVVVVSAKRLSPEQKKQALLDEHSAASKI